MVAGERIKLRSKMK